MGKMKETAGVDFPNYGAPEMERPANYDVLVSDWRKNARERVHIALKEYNGNHLVDVRVFVDPGGTHDIEGMTPTKKGIALKASEIPRLIEGLQEAERTARDMGLLPKSST